VETHETIQSSVRVCVVFIKNRVSELA